MQRAFARRAFLTAMGGALATGLPAVHAQEFPTRTVKVLVGFPPGAGTDYLTRAFTTELQKSFGQSFVVENVVGANGLVAAQNLARAAPDGHTLAAVVPANLHNILLRKDGGQKDYFKEFTPIGPMGAVPMLLVVHPSVAAKTFGDFVAMARAKPGEVTYAGAGPASTVQLLMELMSHKLGIKLLHVPYKGGTPGMQATVAGEVASTWISSQLALPMLQSGKLRALAVSTKERLPFLPEVPTMLESGVPDFVVEIWYGLHGPAGLPRPIVEKLNAEMNRIARTPEMQEKVARVGAFSLYANTEQFTQIITRENAQWVELFKHIQISME